MDGKIGEKVKALRSIKKITLKELSLSSGLSVSYISQVERGLSSINISSLDKIACALGVAISYFLELPPSYSHCVMLSSQQKIFSVKESMFFYNRLANDSMDKAILEPIVVNILPRGEGEKFELYSHEGEEFVYVLEGVLTLFLGSEQFQLNPGDSAHYGSELLHEWANFTSRMVRILAVSSPVLFRGLASHPE